MRVSNHYNADKVIEPTMATSHVGEAVNHIFEILADTEAGEGEDPFEKVAMALTSYFEPKTNKDFDEYQIRRAPQNDCEPIMTYFSNLKQLVQTCEFTDTNLEIKSQIIQHCTLSKVRQKALSEPARTLKGLLDYGKTLEITEVHAAILRSMIFTKSTNSTRGIKKNLDQESHTDRLWSAPFEIQIKHLWILWRFKAFAHLSYNAAILLPNSGVNLLIIQFRP